MTYMHPIKYLSGANEFHLYYQYDKYYIIGRKDGQNCSQLHKLNCSKLGNNCITVEALLKDWLLYNNFYKLSTTLYIDTNINFPDDVKYSPNCHIARVNHHYHNSLKGLNDLNMKKTLLLYYEKLGYFLFDQHLLLPTDGTLYNFTLMDMPYYFKAMDTIGPYAKKLYFDQLNTIKGLKFSSFQSFVLHLYKLFDILNVIEFLSQMITDNNDNHIIYTNHVEYVVDFFKWMHYHEEFSVKNASNCLMNIPISVPLDEIRWIVHRTDMTQSDVIVTLVKTFDYKINIIRSGVLLYTYEDGKLYIGFGIDRVYDEYTDFGGKVEKNDKNAITAALRELDEESNGLYKFTPNGIQKSLILYDHKMAIIFIYVDMASSKQFKATDTSELKGIIWLTEEDTRSELKRPHSKIYNVVKMFLLRSGDFYKNL